MDFFLLLWVIFALLDPDPDPLTRLNSDPIGIRIRNPNSGYIHRPRMHSTELVGVFFVKKTKKKKIVFVFLYFLAFSIPGIV